MRCLESRDVQRVRSCLGEEPQAISQFFWDCGFEPALCFEMRCGCSPEMVRLLLQHGADAVACGKLGYSPLTCLASLPLPRASPILGAIADGQVHAMNLQTESFARAHHVLQQRLQVARL